MHTKQKKVIWNSQHGFTEDLGALVGDQGDHELTGGPMVFWGASGKVWSADRGS